MLFHNSDNRLQKMAFWRVVPCLYLAVQGVHHEESLFEKTDASLFALGALDNAAGA